ncbi:MAG: hypothetical protein ABF692_07210, partial [Lacticaseibacillus paracasei]
MSLFYLTNLLHLNCKSVTQKNPRIGGTRGFLSTPLGVVPTSFYFGGVKMKKSWVGVVVRRG